jgi:hypothetical protein
MTARSDTQTTSGEPRDPRATGAPKHPAPARDQIALGTLWFGLFGAAAAWSVQTVANYVVASHTCFPRLYPLATPTIGRAALWWIVVIVSLVALVIGVLGGLAALRSWRATREETGGHAHWALETGEGRTRFMASAGLVTSGIFIIAILVNAASAVLVNPCW